MRRDETTETPHNWRHEQGSLAAMQYYLTLLYWPGLIYVGTEVAENQSTSSNYHGRGNHPGRSNRIYYRGVQL